MSTVGFGDYYPVSDFERLVWAFLMLCGVATFSYFQGELHAMLAQLETLYRGFNEDNELVKFFGLLRYFNG